MGKREILKEHILNEIRLGRLQPGGKLDSRSVFMEKFDCARATVDQVIMDLVGSKILVSEKGRGTYVAVPAKHKTSSGIAIAAQVIDHPSMPKQIIHGFLEQIGGSSHIRFFPYDELKYPQSWEKCKSQRGIVFIQPDVQHSPLINEARLLNIPHLVLYRDPAESSFVSIDNYGAVAGLVDALHARGCRKIAYVGIRQSRYHFPEQRYAGFLEGILRNQLALNKAWVGLMPQAAVDAFLKKLFSAADHPDAVVAAQGSPGLIIKAAEARGLVMGRDLLLANVDEIPENTYSFPTLSSRTITGEIGKKGAALFFQLLENPDKIVQQYITPDVVEQ